MKKLIAVVFALLMLSSCGSFPEPDVHELADSIISGQAAGEFKEADGDMISLILDVDANDYSDSALFYSSEPACADIIVIFKTDKSDLQSETKKILSDFRESRLKDFKGYAPEEAVKIEDSEVISKGKYVIWAVMPDGEAAKKQIDSAFSK